MSLLILSYDPRGKATSYLNTIKQFKTTVKPAFSILEVRDKDAADFETFNQHPSAKGGIIFVHSGMAVLKKDKPMPKGEESWFDKTRGYDLWFDGSSISVSELVNLFVYKKPKRKGLYPRGYPHTYPPVVIPLFVDEITPRVSSIINETLGIDEFGRTIRKVYVVAIPLGQSATTKKQTAKKMGKALLQLANILKIRVTLGDIVKQFPGAKHYAQYEQYDSDDTEEIAVRKSLDNALDVNIGRIKRQAKAIRVYRVKEPGRKMYCESDVVQTEDEVNCTVYAPKEVLAGTQFLVQVFAHTTEQMSLLDDLAKSADDAASRRGSTALEEKIARESRIEFNLMMPELKIDEPVLSIKWKGKIVNVQFGVEVPANFAKPDIIGKVMVTKNSIPIGLLKFKINVVAAGTALRDISDKNSSTMKRFEQAFISYASQDRPEVLKRVQMLNLVKLKFFQDLLTLEAGDKWEKQIYHYISTCDVFFIFWSKAASESKWVRKEVLYALGLKGSNDIAPPEIIPVIIEGPPPAKPPAELNFLHFNDKFIYFINPRS